MIHKRQKFANHEFQTRGFHVHTWLAQGQDRRYRLSSWWVVFAFARGWYSLPSSAYCLYPDSPSTIAVFFSQPMLGCVDSITSQPVEPPAFLIIWSSSQLKMEDATIVHYNIIYYTGYHNKIIFNSIFNFWWTHYFSP